MTTEQETGRETPGRRATLKPGPKTGTRRLGAPHQSKPRPRPDVESKLSAAERARLDLDGKGSAAERARTDGARVRTDASTASPRTRTDVGGKRPVTERVRPAAGTRSGSADAQVRRPAPRRRPARRQRAPFVLLVVGLLCGGLVSLLLLNTMLAKDAITDAKLRDEISVAKQEKEQIDQNYQLKMQPGNVADMARNQGLHSDWDKVNSYTGDDAPAGQADTER
ncbi:hypothetical protein [Nonomuraea helvata]|uniref:Cell division protein FtsL n=1 Tax=Nonomuraea helvata TaxID=37484 RepID=A0ABV5RZC2_9ACTN